MKTVMRQMLLVLTVLLTLSATSCASKSDARRVVFVSPGQVVRIGPDVKGHVYYFVDSQWTLSAEPVKLPEGWYATNIDAPGK